MVDSKSYPLRLAHDKTLKNFPMD